MVDNIRTNETSIFIKANETKAKANEKEGAYSKLEQDLVKLKSQIEKANQAKHLFDDFFADLKNP